MDQIRAAIDLTTSTVTALKLAIPKIDIVSFTVYLSLVNNASTSSFVSTSAILEITVVKSTKHKSSASLRSYLDKEHGVEKYTDECLWRR